MINELEARRDGLKFKLKSLQSMIVLVEGFANIWRTSERIHRIKNAIKELEEEIENTRLNWMKVGF